MGRPFCFFGKLAAMRSPGPVVLGLVGFTVALLVLVPGLGSYGIWSDGEILVLDRARAALGEALSGLVRSPWFPDAVRTRSYAMFDGELGLRLPHAVCGAALVGIAVGWARRREASVAVSFVAGALALSFPLLVTSSRTALGNPVGELAIVLAVIAGIAALRCTTMGRAAVWATLGAIALALSIASTGIVVGGTLPLAVLAVSESSRRTSPALVLAAAAIGTLALGVWLALDRKSVV